jgi:MFS family permease
MQPLFVRTLSHPRSGSHTNSVANPAPEQATDRPDRAPAAEPAFLSGEALSQAQLETGLNALVKDGIYSQIVGTLTSGVLLVGFAMELGASNLAIGLLASLPFLAQLCQLPAIALVERFRARRRIALIALSACRALMVPIAFLPLLGDGPIPLGLLIGGVALSAGLGSIGSCAWNSWMRDLVPQRILGDFFGRRLFFATFYAMLFGLAGGLFVDHWDRLHLAARSEAYTVLFLLGAIAGGLNVWYLAKVPEPRMASAEPHQKLSAMLRAPLADRNFRRLMLFLGSWHFSVNLAAPFFAVYLMTQLDYDIWFVTGLTVMSQIANMLMLRQWGRLADAFSNKAVLSVCTPLFLTCIVAFPFTAMPEKHAFTAPLLMIVHVLMGAATAGITLASGNIGLKLAPRGRATAYLASTSLVTSIAAGLAPIVGGLFADDFVSRELSVVLRWASSGDAKEFIAIKLRHWDFFFVLASALGLYALHRLGKVKETGEVKETILIRQLVLEARRTMINLSSVGGLRAMTAFPTGLMQTGRLRRLRHAAPVSAPAHAEAAQHPGNDNARRASA